MTIILMLVAASVAQASVIQGSLAGTIVSGQDNGCIFEPCTPGGTNLFGEGFTASFTFDTGTATKLLETETTDVSLLEGKSAMTIIEMVGGHEGLIQGNRFGKVEYGYFNPASSLSGGRARFGAIEGLGPGQQYAITRFFGGVGQTFLDPAAQLDQNFFIQDLNSPLGFGVTDFYPEFNGSFGLDGSTVGGASFQFYIYCMSVGSEPSCPAENPPIIPPSSSGCGDVDCLAALPDLTDVPEPITAAPFGAGFAGAVAMGRRKRSSTGEIPSRHM